MPVRVWHFAGFGKFASSRTAIKIVERFLGDVLLAVDVDGFEPASFSPMPGSDIRNTDLLSPSGQANNRRARRRIYLSVWVYIHIAPTPYTDVDIFTANDQFQRMVFDRESVKARAAALAAQGVYVGTSSWKYEGWLNQLYTPARYEYRGKVAQTRFERDCLQEYAEVFKTVCVKVLIFSILLQTVNLLAYAFDGSNPSPTTTLKAKEKVHFIQYPQALALIHIFVFVRLVAFAFSSWLFH